MSLYLGLETESAYLTHRLSAAQSDNHPTSSGLGDPAEKGATFSEHSRGSQFPDDNTQMNVPPEMASRTCLPSRPKPQSLSRSRTRSGPMVGPNEVRKRHLNPPSVSLTSPTSLSGTSGLQFSPIVSKSTPSGDGSPVTPPPSRIPIRTHSKSQAGSDPDSFMASDRPRSMLGLSSSSTIPTAIGRTSRSPQPQGEVSNTHSKKLVDGPSAKKPRGQSAGELEQGDFREDSPTFDAARITEGFIKNELPPFIMSPDEALRIAERGHNLESDDDAQMQDWQHLELDPYAVSGSSQEMELAERRREKRKRATTMKTSGRHRHVAARSVNKDWEPDFGLPVFGNSSLNAAKPRAQTGSTPPATATSYPISQTSRSVSMKAFSFTPRTPHSYNTLPNSSSRLGVAAHLIPPASTYTPPKGANWDEVVLPAVAKKLGIGEARSADKIDIEPDAEDLAVEWDKNGIPIKWVRKKMEDRTPLNKQTDVSMVRKMGEQFAKLSSKFQTKSPDNKLIGLPFNPTLEPSPNSPFCQSNYDAQHPDTIALGPQREAPDLHIFPPPLSKTISQTSINRKPSFLRKASMQGMTKPSSQKSTQGQRYDDEEIQTFMGNDSAPGQSQCGVPSVQAPTAGSTHRLTDSMYEKHMNKHSGMTSLQANMSRVGNVQSGKAVVGSRRNKKAKEDSHNKGCGCAIM